MPMPQDQTTPNQQPSNGDGQDTNGQSNDGQSTNGQSNDGQSDNGQNG
jgi:hypothetical protein